MTHLDPDPLDVQSVTPAWPRPPAVPATGRRDPRRQYSTIDTIHSAILVALATLIVLGVIAAIVQARAG